MGGVSSKVNEDIVQKEVFANPVVVYSKSGCNYCTKTKDLLNEEKIEYVENNLDELKQRDPATYKPLVNGLVYTTRTTGVPQIFICGKFIGGYGDLTNLRDSKELLAKVAECTGENAKKEE